jgi:hypothetical protein
MNQDDVNNAFIPLKTEWDRMVAESGKTEQMFIATETSASIFLSQYADARTAVEANGLIMPELVKGLTVAYS